MKTAQVFGISGHILRGVWILDLIRVLETTARVINTVNKRGSWMIYFCFLIWYLPCNNVIGSMASTLCFSWKYRKTSTTRRNHSIISTVLLNL